MVTYNNTADLPAVYNGFYGVTVTYNNPVGGCSGFLSVTVTYNNTADLPVVYNDPLGVTLDCNDPLGGYDGSTGIT
jgi:hypothetical protein